MKLVLIGEVENLGSAGDVVTVKDGYGRNFLIPQGKAIVATKGAVKSIEENNKQAFKKREALLKEAKSTAEKLAATSVTISVHAGEDGKLFGTVTNVQVAEALNEKGFEVDRRKVTIDDVKHLGEYVAHVQVQGDIKAEVKVWVVKSEK
jgi:large subunit ribosomal protein L9